MEAKQKDTWFCYMLRCGDGSFYVGITNDLEERLAEHARRKDSEFTAKRLPVKLVWKQGFPSRAEARRREVELKGWSRTKKLGLLRRNPSPSASPPAQGKGA